MPGFTKGNQTFGPGRPGGEFRFAVGHVGEQSAIWKVRASINVVVMSRGLDKEAKITIHESGDSWLATHYAGRGEEVTGKPSRELVRWTPPAPDAAGWVEALNVWVPHGELNNIYTEDEAQGRIPGFGQPNRGTGSACMLFSSRRQASVAAGAVNT